MPIRKLANRGYRWGSHGKVYASREDAVRQARAAYAHGYHESSHEHKVKAIKQAIKSKK